MTSPLSDQHRPPDSSLSRRRFIESTAALGTALMLMRTPSTRAFAADAPESLSAATLAQRIQRREISCIEAMQTCLARLEAVNPKLNAMITICRERALAQAHEADLALASGKLKGALHGVPFSISDAFDSAGVVSTGGTLGRRSFVPVKDATVVARARAAGAILIGKSNVSELSLEQSGNATTNLVCGATRNPYDTRRIAVGASGGSGAIVACGASFFDVVASEEGAVRRPAAACGLAGLQPTLGRLPRTGHIIGYGGAFDTFIELGPVARSVEDLLLLLPILSGPDGADATLAPVPLRDPRQVELASLRVAQYGLEADDTLKRFATQMVVRGAKVVADSPPRVAEFNSLRAQYETGDGHAHVKRLLRKYGTRRRSPELAANGKAVASPEFSRLCEALDAIKSEQLAWLQNYDLLICSADEKAPIGWPAGIVRSGTTKEGMPSCIQLIAQPWREDILLAAMLFAEQQGGGWKSPSPAVTHT